MRQQPSSMPDLVSGKKNRILKHKTRGMEDIKHEPSIADRDRSALVATHAILSTRKAHGSTPNSPVSRKSVLNIGNVEEPYEITSPRPEARPVPSSPTMIDKLFAGYAERNSSDSEAEDVPHDVSHHDGVPLVTSTSLASGNGKKRVGAQSNEWSSDDSEDERHEDYKPSTKEITKILDDQSAAKDAHNRRRSEKYWLSKQHEASRSRCAANQPRHKGKNELDGQKDSKRPSKVVKLTLSPKGQTSAKTIASVRQTTIAKPEFPKVKRVVKKDGYSQTPNAVDYRARIAYQKELEGQLRELIDQDIVEQVEAEGWITPVGRLLKAGVRMLERTRQEREAVDEANQRVKDLFVDGEQRKMERLESENEKLRGGLQQMRVVLAVLDLSE